MDKDIEKKIIDAFIVKRKRERAEFELWNQKKRRIFIWHISQYIDEEFSQKITQSVSSYEIIYKILREHGAPETCYVLESDGEMDGKEVPLSEALEKIVFWGPALISCIHGKLAYIEEEPDIGAPGRYLLIRD